VRLLVLLASVCAFVVATSAAAAQGGPLPAPARVADDALARAFERGALSEAEYALERARSLFRLEAVRREFGAVARPDPHAATFILRDLAFRVRDLSGSERREAEAILARPNDDDWPPDQEPHYAPDAIPAMHCDDNMCLHWDENAGSGDAPPEADGDPGTVPPWATTTMGVFQNVWTKEVDTFGYREPRPDADSDPSGDPRLDIYLLDLGAYGIFGYCAWDSSAQASRTRAAYCAVDNDFLEFCGDLPCARRVALAFLRVTAAHEFFHAVQFAYDAMEDRGFMEQTAMWMEDEVYDKVNDNRNYLWDSALRKPHRPLDYEKDLFQYGNWIFWRFLSERHGRDTVRRAWQWADAGSEGPNDYSIGALRRALGEKGTSLHAFYAFFGWANRRPGAYYEEGASYPASPLSATYRLRRPGDTGWKASRLDHLTNRYYAFKPRRSVPRKAELRVRVNLPKPKTRPLANLVVFFKSGAVRLKPIALDRAGDGGRRVPFGRAQVRRVELVLTNGGSRIDPSTCWHRLTDYACGGALPLDDRRTYAFRAVVR
jgi:hypothetical protein